jgi:hypothetical protein
MREVFFLIGRRGALLWSDGSDDPARLPDSRARWEAIWRHREELEELSHSHPAGPLAFSEEDRSTMSALSAALGRSLRFSIVAPGGMLACEGAVEAPVSTEPWWGALLRAASGMQADLSEPPAPEQKTED